MNERELYHGTELHVRLLFYVASLWVPWKISQ